jgi:hypothetical protein
MELELLAASIARPGGPRSRVRPRRSRAPPSSFQILISESSVAGRGINEERMKTLLITTACTVVAAALSADEAGYQPNAVNRVDDPDRTSVGAPSAG